MGTVQPGNRSGTADAALYWLDELGGQADDDAGSKYRPAGPQ